MPMKGDRAMPTYAIVTVVEAVQPEEAWESVGGRLLNDDNAQGFVAYVGAPWLVPSESAGESVEYGTDAIWLRLDGESVRLIPAN